jgi:hypothetical protein
MRFSSRAGVATVALAVAGLPLLTGAPALASAAPERAQQSASVSWASLLPCLTPPSASSARLAGPAPADDPAAPQELSEEPLDEETSEDLGVSPDLLTGDNDAPRWREFHDTKRVESTDIVALPKAETTKKVVRTEVEPALPSRVTIPVYAHVIKGTHRGERNPAGPRRVRYLVAVLNSSFAGRQNGNGTPARYRFVLRKIGYTKRDGWYHAYLNGPRDKKMKQKLHRGGASTLNLYINGGGPQGFPVLGWARFPWQYRSAPRLDGVTVNKEAMPGGRASGYNLGDTVVHETGHWLGLFHTFEGGCGLRNDLVSDTPAEAEPSYYCQTSRDTCPAPGRDPVRNFMDYSLDKCMSLFTAGQVRRMDVSWTKWRQ